MDDLYDFYDNVYDIHIMTEGYESGYLVKVEYAEDDKATEVYHVSKNTLVRMLNKLHDVVIANSDNNKDWAKCWPKS